MSADESEGAISQEDIETAKERLTMAMGALFENRGAAERHLQHAHMSLGGKQDELYREWDDACKRR
jgi:hypothetical protein